MIKTVQRCVADVLELRAEQNRTEASRVLGVLRTKYEKPDGSLMAFPRSGLPRTVEVVQISTLKRMLFFHMDKTC